MAHDRVRGRPGVRPDAPAAAVAAAVSTPIPPRAADSDPDADANHRRRPPRRLRPPLRRQLRRRRRRPISTRPNIRLRTMRSPPTRSPPTMPARPARASRSGSSTAASTRASPSSPAGSIRPAATSPATAASATKAGTAPRSARSPPRRATIRTRWASRSTRPSSASAPTTRDLRDRQDGCKFFDDAIAAGIDAARVAGAKVINLSLGGSAPGAAAARGDAARGECRHRARHFGRQRRHDPQGRNPDPFALVPAQNFPGSVIIAGSVGVDDGDGGSTSTSISTSRTAPAPARNCYLAALGYQRPRARQDRRAVPVVGHQLLGADHQRRGGADGAGLPNLTGSRSSASCSRAPTTSAPPASTRSTATAGSTSQRAFQPVGATSLAGSQTPVSRRATATCPPAAGDAGDRPVAGAIILDGYSRAFVLNLAKTLRQADSRPAAGARAAAATSGSPAAQAGPVSIAMTVRERHDLPDGYRARAARHRARRRCASRG